MTRRPWPIYLPGQAPELLSFGQNYNQGGIGCDGTKAALLANYAEEIDGYQERWNADGEMSIVRTFKVLWGGRFTWRNLMLGYSFAVNASQNPDVNSTYLISRVIPDQIPEVGAQHLYCSDVKLIGAKGTWGNNPNVFATADGVPGGVATPNPAATPGGPGGQILPPVPIPMIAYFTPDTRTDGLAIYEASYTPRPYEIRSDAALATLNPSQFELERYVEFEMQPSIQTIPLPSGSVIFTPGTGCPNAGMAIPENANFLYVNTIALTYTLNEWPDYPAAPLAACVGTTNVAAFDGARGRQSYAIDTCLMQAPLRVQRYRHPTGRVYWRITLSALYRAFFNPILKQVIGWNGLPATDGNIWPIQRANGAPLYPQSDFAAIWRPVAPVTYQ